MRLAPAIGACGVAALALLMAPAMLTVPALGQQPAPPTFKTEANYVRVDVYPTQNGAPVTDLGRDDFELLEDNQPQAIEAFEHVSIRGSTPQDVRVEPSTVAESRAMLANARARVFVIFLDVNHVTIEGSANIRAPLVRALDELIAPDDLVGVMTPEMSPADITFARRTTTIEGILTRHWTWGERDRTGADEREQAYRICYPGYGPTGLCADDDRRVADEMIERRREKQTLDAVDDLVDYLRVAREERKALLLVSDGWLLFRPNQALARRLNCTVPQSQLGVDPRNGRLTNSPPSSQAANVPLATCEADRMALAQLNDADQFERLLDKANRSNVSFYPVDPRGLPVFDTPIDRQHAGDATSIVPPSVDAAMLRNRQSSLRDLAAATDGIAVMNSNDLSAGFRRVVADLSSYYLLGYYSSGKLDGKYHAIKVRVKRPGVQVRARRGYLAATARDVRVTAGAPAARGTAAASPASPPSAASLAASAALTTALSSLGAAARDVPLRVMTVGGSKADGAMALWAVAELQGRELWSSGGEIDLMLAGVDGATIATSHQKLAAGAHGVRVAFDVPRAGEYALRLRAVPTAGGPAATEIFRVSVPGSAAPGGAIVSRRGPSTANAVQPTADLRFRRNEQIQVDVPAATGTWSARLLDRTGKPMNIPLTVTSRESDDGARWQSTTLPLAPLAPGDYVIELADSGGAADQTARILTAFRIVP